MRTLATDFWWRIEIAALVWANFLLLAILAIGFGGFLGSLNGLIALVSFWGQTFPFLGLPAVALGFAAALAWQRVGKIERAVALAVLSGLALGTYVTGWLLMNSR